MGPWTGLTSTDTAASLMYPGRQAWGGMTGAPSEARSDGRLANGSVDGSDGALGVLQEVMGRAMRVWGPGESVWDGGWCVWGGDVGGGGRAGEGNT